MPCYAGIDAHKADLHTTVLEADGDEIDNFTVANEAAGFAELSDRLELDDFVGIEASTVCYPVVEHLLREGLTVRVGHPKKLAKLMDPDYKDDDRDSWHIADLLRVGRFPIAYHPDANAFLARDVLRRREDLGQATGDLKRRIKSLLSRYGLEPPVSNLYTKKGVAWLKDAGLGDDRDLMLRQYAEQYELLEKQKAELETELARRAWEVPEVKDLVTIEGIGPYSALSLVFEIGPVERFDNLGKFRGYVGSAPRVRQSGDTEHVDGERSSSNHRVKAVLGRATQCLIRSGRDNPIKAYYHKQRDNGCTKKQAKARARGKLSNSVYAMLRKGEPCEWSDPDFADRKLTELERAATAARA
jgi:transposase